MILAGDIGGTKTRLALFERPEPRQPVAQQTVSSREHADFDTIVREFVAAHPVTIEAACFGVAGPVRDGRSTATNLPWVVDAAALAQQLDTAHAWVINDLEATAYGTAVLLPDDYCELNAGAPGATGNLAVIAAGTGLGEAGLCWDGQRHHPFASEGGHASFAPRDDLDVALWNWLRRQWADVSWERVLSGPGLLNIYRFLKDTGRGEEPDWLRVALQNDDPAAVISRTALEKRSPLCEQALDLFVSSYGAEAGNLALKLMATGGVFVGGGIAPKNVDKMKDGGFMKAFCAKGRMKPVLEAMPVRVILNQHTPLLGAAHCARIRLGAIDHR